MSPSTPSDRRYTREHEWVRLDAEQATIGITDYAQSQLGDVVFLELPEVGRVLKAGDVFGTVESVKAVSELYAPVAGEVVAVNSPLVSGPEKINSDPYGEGWMIKVRLADAKSEEGLMDAAAYEARVAEESK